MNYGYIRVSSYTQKIDRQYEEMIKFGIKEENIFIDIESGKDFNRYNYQKMMSILKENDLLVLKSIDRLGRNYSMIIDEWRKITKEIKSNIFVLDIPILDTRDNENKLMGKFIADIVLQILSFVAENERENIKNRQKEGIKIAKEKGIKFGRPKKLIDIKIINNYKNKLITLNDAVRLLKVSKSTIYRYLKENV